jgi:hypothetical protein
MLRRAASAECPIMISITRKCVRINHRKRDGWEKGRGGGTWTRTGFFQNGW